MQKRGQSITSKYNIIHPEKYVGRTDNVYCRSSWEIETHRFFDMNPNIIKWSSEPIAIPYLKPTDNKIHRYYPDYWVMFKKRDGLIAQQIIEIKPAAQLKQPQVSRKNKKTQLYESIQYAINQAKWKAAYAWCQQYKIEFRILTENDIFK